MMCKIVLKLLCLLEKNQTAKMSFKMRLPQFGFRPFFGLFQQNLVPQPELQTQTNMQTQTSSDFMQTQTNMQTQKQVQTSKQVQHLPQTNNQTINANENEKSNVQTQVISRSPETQATTTFSVNANDSKPIEVFLTAPLIPVENQMQNVINNSFSEQQIDFDANIQKQHDLLQIKDQLEKLENSLKNLSNEDLLIKKTNLDQSDELKFNFKLLSDRLDKHQRDYKSLKVEFDTLKQESLTQTNGCGSLEPNFQLNFDVLNTQISECNKQYILLKNLVLELTTSNTALSSKINDLSSSNFNEQHDQNEQIELDRTASESFSKSNHISLLVYADKIQSKQTQTNVSDEMSHVQILDVLAGQEHLEVADFVELESQTLNNLDKVLESEPVFNCFVAPKNGLYRISFGSFNSSNTNRQARVKVKDSKKIKFDRIFNSGINTNHLYQFVVVCKMMRNEKCDLYIHESNKHKHFSSYQNSILATDQFNNDKLHNFGNLTIELLYEYENSDSENDVGNVSS